MKKCLIQHYGRGSAALALLIAVRGAWADPSVSYVSGTYTQNFNTLATYSPTDTAWSNNTTAPYYPPVNLYPIPPVQINNYVNGVDNTNGYTPVDLTGASTDFFNSIQTISFMTGWYAINYGGNSTPLTYTVSDGSRGTAALTGFFNPNDPGNLSGAGTANNMGLGATTASGTGYVEFGVKLINNSTVSLNAISMSYAGQLFYEDSGQKSLAFGYMLANGTASIPIAGLTTYSGLNVGGFATGATGSTFQTENISVTNLPLSAAWAPGAALWLTWTMDSAGGGQGLAIDDLSFSAAKLATFPTLTWNLPGSGTWDTSLPNWTSVSNGNVFANGNNAVFGNIAGDATISVTSSGVTISSSITINNSANTYTFAGGSISGSLASLTISGGGSVRLTAPNGYGFATNVNSGTLIVDNNNELGAPGAQLNFQGGKMMLAGSIDASTRPMVVNASGGTFATGGHNAAFGGATGLVHITGTFEIGGGGSVNLGLAPAFGSQTSTSGHLVVDAGTTVIIEGDGRSTAMNMWDGGVINGTLVLQTFTPSTAPAGVIPGGRFNFQSGTANGAAVISGIGVIQVPTGSVWMNSGTPSKPLGSLGGTADIGYGAIISNVSNSFGANIGVRIQLNSLEGTDGAHPAFVRTDVTAANAFDGTSTTGNFITVIGGTKKGNAGIGPTFSLTTYSNVISGDSDISMGNDYKSGGSGNIILTAHNTYHGVTMLNGGGTSLPVLYLGINDALPTDTDLAFGTLDGAGSPSLDLNGFNQTVQSLCIGQGTNSPSAVQINNSGPTPSTLTISGAITPHYPFNGQINDLGPTLTDVNGNPIAFGGSTTALVKDGPSTLVLGEFVDNSSSGSTISTYSGGTTAKGGVIQIPFDGALGNATGSLTFDGGTVAIVAPDLNYLLVPSLTWSTDRALIVTSNGGTIHTPAFSPVFNGATSPTPIVASVVFTGGGSYNWGGNLQFTGDVGSNVTINGSSNVTVLAGASVTIAPNVSLTLAGALDPMTDSLDSSKHVAIVSNGLLQVTGGDKAVGGISGTGSVTVAFGTTLTSDGVNLPAGSLIVDGTQTIRSSGTTGAYYNFATGRSSAMLIGTSKIAGAGLNITGTLDIKNNALIVEAADSTSKATLLATLAGELGTTITSSTATTNSHYTLDVIDNGQLGASFFGGLPVDPNSIIVTEALKGDANMDGNVTLADLTMWKANFGKANVYAANIGDFNHDGNVTLADLTMWKANFGANVTTYPAPSDASTGGLITFPTATFGGVSAVPEPAGLSALGIGALLLLRRRPGAR